MVRPAESRFAVGACLVLTLALVAVLPAGGAAQERSDVVVAAGVGMTFYAISTRVDTGSIFRGSLAYGPLPWLLVEAGARWHRCPDCHGFSVVEGGVQLRRPAERVSPFVAVGGGRSSDPEFMGSEWGLHASVGSWFWLPDNWGLQLELRGRQVGSGAHMGEFSVGVARRFPGGSP